MLPVKGVRDDSYANWQSQVTSMYGGPLDFIFVVEAEDEDLKFGFSDAVLPEAVDQGEHAWCTRY